MNPNLALSARRQRGLSLVELMVAVAIGLFLLAGLAGIFANSSRNHSELAKSARQIENGRFAMQTMQDDVTLAGFYGFYYWTAAPAALPDPCELNNMTNLRTALAVPVQGYNSPAAPAAPLNACLPDVNHLAGTDILVVRRAATAVTAPAALVLNDVYFQSNSDPNGTPTVNTGTPANFTVLMRDAATPAPIRKYVAHIYFIAPCSVAAGGTGSDPCVDDGTDDQGAPVPTLKRLELTVVAGVRTMAIVPLVEGVENMQIEYGVDNDGDGVPDGAFTAAPATAADWANVVALNVHLLVRNNESTAGYVDAKTYNLGAGVSVTPGGNYKRHVYTSQFRIVNVGGRRETP